MDRHLIKSLIDAFEASGLSELEYSRDGATLRLVKGGAAPGPVAHSAAPDRPRPAPAPPVASPVAPPVAAVPDVVAAPLYGIVHLQRSPGAPPFVVAGQMVEAGAVLCTIEAMKVFTDVRAERAGAVAAILVANGQEVEAGQTLVRLA